MAPVLLVTSAGDAAMAKIESIRLLPHRVPVGDTTGDGAARLPEAAAPAGPLTYQGHAAALLDLLSAGDPPAFATDSRDRIVFWNSGMSELMGKRADEVLGHRCYETMAGRDVFGNRFCYANCSVVASFREEEKVNGFELKVAANGSGRRAVTVTILKLAGVRPDLFTLVHILQPISEESRVERLLERLGAGKSMPRVLTAPEPADAPPLTRRETEVLNHVAAGLQNKEVAQKLHLSLATVRNHIHNILDKLGVHSKLEAVALSFRKGWIARNPDPNGPPPAAP
jgi:DNA-binding CsgD family transcriptional regulator